MTNIDKKLYDFMTKYYGRKQLENDADYNVMIAIFKEVYPYEPIAENCIGCRTGLLIKLQGHYETLCAYGVYNSMT